MSLHNGMLQWIVEAPLMTLKHEFFKLTFLKLTLTFFKLTFEKWPWIFLRFFKVFYTTFRFPLMKPKSGIFKAFLMEHL